MNNINAKENKITDKAFMQNITIAIVSILICIAALCSITFAWFGEDVSSSNNKIKSGLFDLTVSVAQDSDNEEILPAFENTYTLTQAGTYIVTLTPVAETSARGYCIVTINDKQYKTDIIVAENATNDIYPTSNTPFTFQITVTEPDATLTIEFKWGIYADDETPIIENGSTISNENN